MAKSPAVLFYTSDFLTGTTLFTDEQTGQYIKLLCHQHQLGHLPKNHMISVCLSYDSPVIKKFMIDNNGLYYNKRMDEEIEKRASYCNSRSNNKSGRKNKKSYDKSYGNHMNNHMDNENDNENKDIKEDDNKNKFDLFRTKYPGTKRGNETEYNNFIKKHGDWKDILPLLSDIIDKQIAHKKEMEEAKMFVPEWKHLSTWINNRGWEEELPAIKDKNIPDWMRDVKNFKG